MKISMADYARMSSSAAREQHARTAVDAGTAASLGYKTLIDAYKEREIGALGAGQVSEDALQDFDFITSSTARNALAHFMKVGVDVQRFERSRYAKNDSALAEMQILDEDEHWHKVKSSSLRPVITHAAPRGSLWFVGHGR